MGQIKPLGTLPEMDDLAEQIGEFIHYWGFKRVHGRIWTHLYLADGPLDAADMVREMRISKALISISLRELIEFDVIRSAGRSARGTQLYSVNPDILSVILRVLRQREKRMLSRVGAAHETLMRVPQPERQRMGLSDLRLQALGDLTGRASIALEALIALRSVDFGEWRKAFMVGEPSDDDSAPSSGEELADAHENASEAHDHEPVTSSAYSASSYGDEMAILLPMGRQPVRQNELR